MSLFLGNTGVPEDLLCLWASQQPNLNELETSIQFFRGRGAFSSTEVWENFFSMAPHTFLWKTALRDQDGPADGFLSHLSPQDESMNPTCNSVKADLRGPKPRFLRMWLAFWPRKLDRNQIWGIEWEEWEVDPRDFGEPRSMVFLPRPRFSLLGRE